MDALQKEG